MLQFDKEVYRKMQEDAEAAFPDECCGFLFGNERNGIRNIEDILPVMNAKEGDKKRRFEIAPLDYLRAERYAEERSLLLFSIYHSHPNHPAVPSEHDRVAAQPYFSYVIVSVMDGKQADTRSWILNDQQQFEEENIAQEIINHSY